jgi:predicted site-specific integrase-resolvase
VYLRKMTPMQTTPVLLPTAEAAQIIGVDASTLSRWVASGRISVALKINGKTGPMLFTPAEVERVRAEYAASTEQAAS